MEAGAARGADVFFDFKHNATPKGLAHYDAQLAHCMGQQLGQRRLLELEVPRYRPFVETVNSMIKRGIKRVVRARTDEARTTELLLAVLAHNLRQLIMARRKYRIAIPFADARANAIIDGVLWPKEAAAEKVA